MSLGHVILLGAGPGDINLITARGLDALRRADAIVYDRLVNLELLQLASPCTERIDVGKASGRTGPSQEEICRLLVEQARRGRTVVRLKGGDPFVFGRGGEEALALAEAGIPFEVIPGVTAGIAAPAYAGIPVTHRGLASNVTFITGQVDPTRTDAGINWNALASTGGTLVFYMGVRQLPNITRNLIDAGLAPDTPAVIIQQGTTPEQRSVRSTVHGIAHAAAKADIKPPAVTVIGKVAGLPEELNWFERLPLFGKRIVVTRAIEQADATADILGALGARPILFPTIEIADPPDWNQVDAAVAALDTFDWVVFTSVNAATTFLDHLFELGRDVRAFGSVRIACLGPVTADAVAGYALRADLVPREATSPALAREMTSSCNLKGKRILLPRSDIAREELPRLLAEAGAEAVHVTTYITRTAASPSPETLEQVRRGECDVVTFTSPSTVCGFVEIVGAEDVASLRDKTLFAAIGPVSASAARQAGIEVAVEATDHTMEGLIDALCEYYAAVDPE